MGFRPRIGERIIRALAATWVAASACLCWGATAWLGAPYAVVMGTHINGIGQSFTGSTGMLLEHDTPCSVSVSVPQPGDEVLKLGTGGPTLTTKYKITGIASGDSGWVDSTTFLSRTYAVPGNNITDALTLSVQGTAPADAAPEAGDYTATIILTITF